MKISYSPIILKVMIAVGGACGTFLVWSSLTLPTQRELLEVKNASTNINQKKIRLIDHATGLNALAKDESAVTDLANRAKALLPEKSATVDFVLQLEEMAKSLNREPTNLTVAEEKSTAVLDSSSELNSSESETNNGSSTAAKPASNTTKNQPSYGKATFLISFIGDFEQIKQFLALLKTVDRFNTVDQVSITTTTSGLSATFNGFIYFKKIPDFTVKPESAITKIDPSSGELSKRKHFGDPLSTPSVSQGGSTNPFGSLSL